MSRVPHYANLRDGALLPRPRRSRVVLSYALAAGFGLSMGAYLGHQMITKTIPQAAADAVAAQTQP